MNRELKTILVLYGTIIVVGWIATLAWSYLGLP